KLHKNSFLKTGSEFCNFLMHIDFKSESANKPVSKCKNCTLEELAIIKEIAKNPSITQKELAGIIGKSERTVKNRTVEMQEKGLIVRENGKQKGRWRVLAEI
ncbi:MAG: winged helix-turn-helix domain-containing protein, partial [Bullifex sp.]